MGNEKELREVVLGNTDEDADWILTREQREEEMAIHDKIAAEHEKRKKGKE